MKKIILSLIILFILLSGFSQQRPIVGAIRWDAWQGETDKVGKQVNKSLSPQKWHSRLPFFAQVINDDSVNIDGSTQSVIDKEILFAKQGRLDYFAFLLYDENFSLSAPLHNYLKSQYKSSVNFCVIAQEGESISRLINYITDKSYQTVLNGRPLVYTFRLRDKPELVRKLKDTCNILGIKEPYVADLHWLRTMPASPLFDAISDYWIGSEWGVSTGAPYSKLKDYASWDWNQRLQNNAKQVLCVSLGGDGRPRIENPVSWIDDPVDMYGKYYETPRPEEFIAHLKDAFEFISANPHKCEANAVLIYAWNENDEGGWLVPTLNANGSINSERIDALAKFLGEFDN